MRLELRKLYPKLHLVFSWRLLKAQDEASDKAYAILIALIKQAATTSPDAVSIAAQARQHLVWIIQFFESQLRHDRAIVLIRNYLTDRPPQHLILQPRFRLHPKPVQMLGRPVGFNFIQGRDQAFREKPQPIQANLTLRSR